MAHRLAAIQFCAGPDWQTNRNNLEPLLQKAAGEGAQLVLLPENFACYGGDYRRLGEGPDAVLDWLADQARRHGYWLIAGSLPLASRADGSPVPAPRVRAAQLVFDPQGVCRARYDKLHLFDVDVADAQGRYRESATFEPGERLVLASVAGIMTGLEICYDLRFPTQSLALAQAGAELLVYPSAFTALTGDAHWHLLLRTRAVETGCFVLAANQCGQHNPRRASFGHSLLVDPWGRVLASLNDEQGVLVAEMDMTTMREVRASLPVLSHQRLGVSLTDDIQLDRQL